MSIITLRPAVCGQLRGTGVQRIWVAALLTMGALVFPATPAQAQTLFCNGLPVTRWGGVGDDTIQGSSGSDVIAAEEGNDTVFGNGGDDTICLGAGRDFATGGTGDDVVFGGNDEDTFDHDAGADSHFGGHGIDTMRYTTRTSPVNVTLDDVANDGAAGEGDNVRTDVEVLLGGSGADRLVTNAAKNNLDGGPGDDVLDGGDGLDHIRGEAGNDVLIGGEGQDVLVGGTGTDIIDGGTGGDSIHAGSLDGGDTYAGGSGFDRMGYSVRTSAVTVTLDGIANDGAVGEMDNVRADVEQVFGGHAADTLRGNGADNRLNGADGNDTIMGLGGDDTLDGGTGHDTLDGGGGDDMLLGDVGDDDLNGFDGVSANDTLVGVLGFDTCVSDFGDVESGCEA
jgi:Ca2+-binding RTX toxin-like protein